MARFSSPESQGAKQSASVMKEIQGDVIQSVGTVRNYEQSLKNIATELARNGESLRDITADKAVSYLEARASEVGQSALNMERQALQVMMVNVTNQLKQGETLTVIKSQKETSFQSKSYSEYQINSISQKQAEHNALATQIAYSTGLRAHELITLSPVNERSADERPSLSEKFSQREGVIYTVTGKGGLTREVSIPKDLAVKLEERRFETPMPVTDRGINYEQKYDIGAGQSWSKSFSKVSTSQLGYSNGAHGLRHTYAQERMTELRSEGLSRDKALEVVSQEMGHFRPEITEVYLR